MAEDLRLNCGEVPSSISERNAQVLKVYVIQRGQNIKANVVRLERLSILGQVQPLQPLANVRHRTPLARSLHEHIPRCSYHMKGLVVASPGCRTAAPMTVIVGG